MRLVTSMPIRFFLLLLISVLFVSGCSSSSDSSSAGSQSPANVTATNGDGVTSNESTNGVVNEMEATNTGDTTSSPIDEVTDVVDGSTTGSSESEQASTTRVNFNITVPVYVSNALQVRLVWGDVDATAVWNSDELWTVSADFPANTTNQLVVTFSDGNGATTLGSVERSFTTGANQSESLQITADEFDTDRWDSDGDGVSNLDELIAGINPAGSDLPQPVQVSLEILPIKTFRFTWQTTPLAQYYRVLENPDGISGFTDISGELEASATNFDHVVALYARVNAQYLVQSCNDQGCVDSDVLMVTGTLAKAIGHFKASSTDVNDDFGRSVSLSTDGNTLAVGAPVEDSGATGINGDESDNSVDRAGAVYVFVRSGEQWQQQAYLKASNVGANDAFGRSVDLSSDGNTLAVGAIWEDSAATGINGDQSDNSAENAGAVYVFAQIGEQWQQQAYIKANNSKSADLFGVSISLSDDGNTLAIGADHEDSEATGIDGDQSDESAENAGAVYVFVRSSGQWQQQAYIKASNTGLEDFFGRAVSLSADGKTLAVGAIWEDGGASGVNGDQGDNSALNAGAVYVFVRSSGQWQQQAYLKASNTGVFDNFGEAISLSADGNTLAIGARENSAATGVNGDQSDNSLENAGAVYVFVRSGEQWQQQAYIKASNTGSSDFFGRSVSLSADGKTLAVSAPFEDSAAIGINGDQSNQGEAEGSGAAYVFVQSGGQWQQQAYLKANERVILFGTSLNLSGDGNTLVIGTFDDLTFDLNGVEIGERDISPTIGAIYLF